jgi:hypothetical protein
MPLSELLDDDELEDAAHAAAEPALTMPMRAYSTTASGRTFTPCAAHCAARCSDATSGSKPAHASASTAWSVGVAPDCMSASMLLYVWLSVMLSHATAPSGASRMPTRSASMPSRLNASSFASVVSSTRLFSFSVTGVVHSADS